LFRKVQYLTGFIFIAILLAFFYREAGRPLSGSQIEPDAVIQKKALIRLEDVSPGVYDTEDKLGKLRAMAEYLHQEGVPFHVSLIPFYRDPKRNVEKNIGDPANPQVKAFIETILYMRSQGGLIGLHGYTHQYQSEVSGEGYEFMEKGTAVFARPEYAEDRVKKALELADKAGIPIDYWETPHYTASPEQYQVMSNYFGLMYEPNPRDKKFKNMSSWDSTGLQNQGVVFVPAPLLNVNAEKDVGRILGQLDKNEPGVPASFFFHPFQENKFMYQMKAPEGYTFYAHETNSYLHRLINGFKERGYTFVTVYDIVHFVPAQRLAAFSNIPEKALLTGDFDGDRRDNMLAADLRTGRFYVARSGVQSAFPRNNPASWGNAEEWLKDWFQGGMVEFVAGDFNGDGLCDLAAFDLREKTVRVALSDGNKLVPQDQLWGVFPALAAPGMLLSGDFDGDKKCDLLYRSPVDGVWKVMLSDGDEFAEPEVWLSGWEQAKDIAFLSGDFNGDGRKDIAMVDRATGSWRAALSSGHSLEPADGQDGAGGWLDHFAAGCAWQFAAGDFNGGGKDDIAACDRMTGKWGFARSTGRKFVLVEWPVIWGKDAKARLLTGDFNGDGKSDLAVERHFGESTPVDTALSVINQKRGNSK
jgi:predicted deacetylase